MLFLTPNPDMHSQGLQMGETRGIIAEASVERLAPRKANNKKRQHGRLPPKKQRKERQRGPLPPNVHTSEQKLSARDNHVPLENPLPAETPPRSGVGIATSCCGSCQALQDIATPNRYQKRGGGGQGPNGLMGPWGPRGHCAHESNGPHGAQGKADLKTRSKRGRGEGEGDLGPFAV
jgi:hypothetical protein